MRGSLQALKSNRDLISPITVGGQNVSEFLAKIAKFLTFRLNNCDTLQDRCVHAAMHLKSIEFSFRLCDIYQFGASLHHLPEILTVLFTLYQSRCLVTFFIG